MFERDESRQSGFNLPWWAKVILAPIYVGALAVDGVKSGAKKIAGKLKRTK